MPTVAAILAVIAVGHVAAVGVAVLVARHGVEVIAGGPDEERCVFGCRSGRCGDGLWLTQLWRKPSCRRMCVPVFMPPSPFVHLGCCAPHSPQQRRLLGRWCFAPSDAHFHLVPRGRCVDDDMPTPPQSRGREPACTADERDWRITNWTIFWKDAGLPAQLAH